MTERTLTDRYYDFEPKLIAVLLIISVVSAAALAYSLLTLLHIETAEAMVWTVHQSDAAGSKTRR